MKKLKTPWTKILIFLVILQVFIPWFKCLSISDNEGIKSITYLNQISRLSYDYKHSVSMSTVIEGYNIVESQLLLDEIIYEDHGAGLPDILSEESFKLEEGKFTVKMDESPMDQITFFILPDYDNHLSVGEKEINLSQVTNGGSITIEVKWLSIAHWLLHKI